MATRRWRGDAPKTAQVNTLTVGGTAADTQVYSVTINGKTVSYTAGSADTNSTIASALKSALAASVIPEFAEVVWSVSTSVITGTAKSAGKPFSNTSAATGSGTLVTATTIANSGPNVVSLAANWEGNAVPVDGDEVVFDFGTSDALYDLDQSAVTPASILVDAGYRGRIGLAETNADDAAATYAEYREKYLRLGNSGDAGIVTVTIRGGAGRIKIDTGSAQAIWNVNDTAQSLESHVPAALLKGTHAANVLNVAKGDVGVALFAGESSSLVAVKVGYKTNRAGDSRVRLGSGVGLANAAIVQTGGALDLNSATTGAATITQFDGTLSINAGAQRGLSVRGGQCIYNSIGALEGGTVVSGDGHLDFSQDLRAKSVADPIDLYGPGARLSDPNQVVAALVVDLDETALSDNLRIGTHIRLTRGTPA
jgi:hypothetical protein